MVAGFDRYFQVVRCFRDEDLRADRQLEFTQIDIEMSFPTEDLIMSLAERLALELFAEAGVTGPEDVPRLTYAEAMERYGCDKPDTRFGLELKTVSEIAAGTSFGVFKGALGAGGVVRGLCVPGQAGISRKGLDDLNAVVKPFGGKGVVSLMRQGRPARRCGAQAHRGGPRGGAARRRGRRGGRPGPLRGGHLRYGVRLPQRPAPPLRQGAWAWSRPDQHDLLWVHRFPMFEWSPDDCRWVARHHPFTMPRPEHHQLLEGDPHSGASSLGKVEALAYDLVLDGSEIGGGSIRIHRGDIQRKVFGALGFTQEQAQEKFGFLLDAFRYGTPPHGGIAFGFDRLVMLLLGCDSIRDVIPFPKTTSGLCLMTGSPGAVEEKQLEELSIKLDKPAE